MIKEFCTENVNDIKKAIQNGASRIELCSRLDVGGTTPSEEMIETATKIAPKKVMVIIRPRGGNFVYSHKELEHMANQIVAAKKYDIQGIVVGCLTRKNQLDKKAMSYLMPFVGDLDITFHMAFDEMSDADQKRAIKWLSQKGINRILTHGGKMTEKITETLPHLIELNEYAKEFHMTIMPGGRITYQNINQVTEKMNVTEIHGTKIVPLN